MGSAGFDEDTKPQNRRGPAGLPLVPPYKIDYTPQKKYPDTAVPVTRPPSKEEKIFVARYRRFRDRCRDGPLYTVLGDSIRVRKPDGNIATEIVKVNTFEAMPTYTNKYKRKKRLIPKLDFRPYLIEFFPQELWSALGPEYGSQAGTPKSAAERKRMRERAKKSRLDELEADIEEAERQREDDEKKENDDDEDKEKDEAEGEDVMRDEEDDDFEDQEDGEDADNDDYNAEKYFDNGEEDYEDVGGGDDYDGGAFEE